MWRVGLCALVVLWSSVSAFADAARFVEEFSNLSLSSEELVDSSSFSASGAFPPASQIQPVDPITGEKFENVLVSPVKYFKREPSRKWRYVTFYRVKKVYDPISHLPAHWQYCHDNWRFADWRISTRYDLTFHSSISLGPKDLGLSAEVALNIAQGVTFETTRYLSAIPGIVAIHRPYLKSEAWRGLTYIQTYDAVQRKFSYYKPKNWLRSLEVYPDPFYLDYQKLEILSKVEKIDECSNYDPKNDPSPKHRREFFF